MIISNKDNITVTDNNPTALKTIQYVPSIEVWPNNTYGCKRQNIKYPAVNLSITSMQKTNPMKAGPSEWIMGYSTVLKITPNLSGSFTDDVFYYRVWRVMYNSDGTIDKEVLLNNEENQSGEGWYSDYEPVKSEWPGTGNIYVNDIYKDRALNGQESKKVVYIVRMYAENSDISDNCVIAENTITATFTTNTITFADNLYTDIMPEYTEYVNISGIRSFKPFEGFNIVIEHYKNGEIKINKKIIY